MYAVVPMLPVYQTPMSLTVCMCCCTAFLFILLQVCWVPLLLHELYLTRSSDKTLPDCSVCTSEFCTFIAYKSVRRAPDVPAVERLN